MQIDEILSKEELERHPKRRELLAVFGSDISPDESGFYEKYLLLPVLGLSIILLTFITTGTLDGLPYLFEPVEYTLESTACII